MTITIETINFFKVRLILQKLEGHGTCSPFELQQHRGLTDHKTINEYLRFLSRGRFVRIGVKQYRRKGVVRNAKLVSITPRGVAALVEISSVMDFLALANAGKAGTGSDPAQEITKSEAKALIKSLAKRRLHR